MGNLTWPLFFCGIIALLVLATVLVFKKEIRQLIDRIRNVRAEEPPTPDSDKKHDESSGRQ